MATFVKEETRGKTLYLLRLTKFRGDKTVYMDATRHLKDASATDVSNGFDEDNGPAFAHELAKAATYADYVCDTATLDNLYKFNNRHYNFFTDTDMPQPRKNNSSDVRTNVSI